jgi:lipoprotein-anchoring transpeptidase ErfK/SrfK
MLARRRFIALGGASLLSACATLPETPDLATRTVAPVVPDVPPMPDHYGPILTEPYPIPAVPAGVVRPELWRQQVANPFPADRPGTIIVDPDAGFLHLVESTETAMRYGVGTGEAGRAWHGEARLQFWRSWPTWRAPDTMIARRPELEPYSVANGGMEPGPGNPLGARALYLFQNGVDTLYRIHGACEPRLLGRRVTAGCVRMLDHDVIDLQERATHGATVRVLRSMQVAGVGDVY